MAAQQNPLESDPEAAVRLARLRIATSRARMGGILHDIHHHLNAESLKETTAAVAEAGVDAAWHALESHLEEAKEAAQEVASETARFVHDATIGKVEGVVQGVRDSIRVKRHQWAAALAPYLQAGSRSVLSAMDNLDEARRKWRSARVKGVSMSIIDTVKANPIAASVAGLSLAWMFAGPTVKSKTAPLMSKASDLACGLGDSAHDFMSDAQDKASSLASEMSNKTQDLLSTAQQKAHDLSGSAQSMVRGAGVGFSEFLSQNPMMVGGLCLCLGLGIGLMLPVTDAETRLLAEERRKLGKQLLRVSEAMSQVVEQPSGDFNEEVMRPQS